MTRLVLTAVCAALAVAPAGCGGSSAGSESASAPPLTRTAYLEKVSSIVTDVQVEHGHVTIDPTEVSQGDVTSVQKALRDLAQRLETVSPPAEVRDLHVDFVSALRGFADELPELTTTIANDPATGLDALLDSEPMHALLRVSQGFTDKGYDVDLERA